MSLHQDCKESFSYAYDPAHDPQGDGKMPEILFRRSQWPEESVAPRYKSTMLEYQRALLALARRFIRIFALALELPEDYFDTKVGHPIAGVRVLHYPPMEGSDDEEIGLGAHTDIECRLLHTPLFCSVSRTNPSRKVSRLSIKRIPRIRRSRSSMPTASGSSCSPNPAVSW
jgi:isopenicillin N synthase-like dioxygenase